MTPPFHFRLAPSSTDVVGSEAWVATAKPPGVDDSRGARFRLVLASPARSAEAGARIQGTLRRNDKEHMWFFLVLLADTFEPPEFERRSGSGPLMPFAVTPADAVPFSLTVLDRTSDELWTALAELENGGRFLLVIDSAAGWGEFRSVGAEYHMQVLTGIVALSASQ